MQTDKNFTRKHFKTINVVYMQKTLHNIVCRAAHKFSQLVKNIFKAAHHAVINPVLPPPLSH